MHMSTELRRYTARTVAEVVAAQGRRQDWLAKRAGVSESLLSMVISGQRSIGQEGAERIAGALGVPLFLLFDMHEGLDSMPDRMSVEVAS